MEKKLLSLLFILTLFFLNPVQGFGQCPTSVTLTANPGTSVCEGTPIIFTANNTGGTNLTYQWEIGGSVVGTGQSYTLNDPQQGQQVKVIISSSETICTSRTSSSLVVNSKKTPTVNITPTKTTICPGENISFSASPTNQGSTPTYEWFVNGTSVQQGSSSTLGNPSNLNQGDNTIRVIMTSSLTCVTTDKAEKTINYTVKPIATIAASTSTEVESCINTAITPIKFDIGGGGTGATVSGLPPGVNGSFSGGVYTISGSPTSAGTYNFTVNTTGTCEQTSATGSITVNPSATLSLTSGNTNQTVCAAGGVTISSIEPITYSIGQTGTNASVSNLPQGITAAYSNGTLTVSGSSSVVGTHSFTVTATGDCGNSQTLTGSITITENKAPSVSISSSDADNEICEGTSVTFTATPSNGGTSPTYQWKIDGNNAGSGGKTFTTSSLEDGQIVTVVLTSSETCRTENTATSNGITTMVNQNLTPSVTIDSSDTDFCAGDEVTYTAIPVNGGPSPTYQWKVGSTVVGSGETFTSSSLTNGQSITVTLNSSETCVTSSTAVSEPVVTSVNDNLVPSVSIVSDDPNNIICSGNNITFTATPTNGGSNPEYQWQVNGVASGNPTTSNSFSPTLNNGDKVSVTLISNEVCIEDGYEEVESNEIQVQIDTDISSAVPAWDNTNVAHNPTAICPSVSGLKYKIEPVTGATNYNWTLPTGWSITNGQGSNEITVTASVSASAGNITVNGRSECGPSQSISLPVTTGTAAHVDAGPDQTVCPGTTEITLNGEIGGVIQQKKDWNWSDNGAGGTFKNSQGSDLKGTYTIPASLRNGGTITIRIQSVKPAGNCNIKTDEMTLTIQSAAAITDPTNKNQTVCINSPIASIPFTISGAGTGATATGLPAGITGSFENGIFTLSGIPTQAGTFNYTVTTTGNCTNTSRTGTLAVNPRPAFTDPQDVFVCAGSDTSLISFTGSSVTGTTYQWTNDNTSIGLAASGTGSVNGFTAVNTTNAPLVANIKVTPNANNCAGTAQEFQITVYPTATFTLPEDLVVCNGENVSEIVFSGSNVSGTSYKWSNSDPSIGLAAEGTGNISSFSGVNTTNSPVDATITVTPVANGCDGTPEEFTITVNPTPAFTAPENIVVCDGEDLSQLDFSGATVNLTSYSWTNSNTAIGLAASGTETGFLPSFTAINNGNEQVKATITVTPFANECSGEPVTFEITVNPTPVVNNIEDMVVCKGEDFSEIVLSSNITGTSYSWTNSNPAIGLTGTGTGNIPAFSAANDTEAAISATITISPTANECEGTPYTFDITVNPSAIVEAGPSQTICSNGVATMAASLGGGATEGTWTSSGSGTFNNNSINAEYTPSDSDSLNGSVTLTFTSNDPEGPCGPASDSLELFINKEVLITNQPENIGVCSTEPSELTVIASGDNLSYEWKRTDGVNITNSNGIYSSTLSFNNTTSVHAGEYYVIVRGEDVCNEGDQVESERVTINVDENIIIEEPVTEVPICGDGFSEVTMKFIAHANGAPLTFKWYKDNVPVDANSDENITITTGEPDAEGRYEGTLHLVNITTAFNGDYYVEISGPEEFTCAIAVTNPFLLRLNELPEPPVVEDLEVCQNESPDTFTVTSGTNLKWYLNETDTEYIVNEAGQIIAPVLSTDVPGDFYYWVTQTPDKCESQKVQVKVTVKEKPSIPVLTSEEAVIEYCLNETAVSLTATGISSASLNWYDSETGAALTSAPTPNTANPGETTYWVSQTPSDGLGCESERAEITVTVFALPEITASVEEAVICKGSSAELSATGGVSYIWYDGEEVIGNEASISYPINVAGNYTFTVVASDENGCENTDEVNVQVDENTVAGTISGQESVCISSPSGSFDLEGNTGEIQRWESSTDNGTSWTEIANNSTTLEFNDLGATTIFRAIVKNGVCDEMPTNEIEVTIDPLPVAGELSFADFGRLYTTCEDPESLVDLNLINFEGQVLTWKYRIAGQTTYTTIADETGESLSAALIAGLLGNETLIFQVDVVNGSCNQPVSSKTAILSVVSSNIEPAPVTVSDEVICLNTEVTLSAETGYESGDGIGDSGNFDNASINQQGWRIINAAGNEENFETSANNTAPNVWRRVTPREFTTADLTSPYSTSPKLFDHGLNDGNKGFALVSGNNTSKLETSVFGLDGLDEAILTFDQAYNLTPGASISVSIFSNGSWIQLYSNNGDPSSGNYTNFASGTPQSRPENKIEIDLGDYIGQQNLRIQFDFIGARPGDVWAVDNIVIPDGPQNVGVVWEDTTLDPENPVIIGYNPSEKWTPTKIGWNVSVITTTLEYTGGSCTTAVHNEEIKVFVFDKYTTSVTADYGSCGVLEAKLSATVTNGNNDTIQSYPTPDGYIGKWVIDGGTLVDSDPDDGIDAINDPNAILSASVTGTYNVSWILEPTEEDENGNLYINPEACPPVVTPLDIVIEGCVALDFDGVDDYVDLGITYTGNYSIEAWVKPATAGGTIISGPQFNITAPSGLSTTRWTHVAVTDGTLYIDGVASGAPPAGDVGDRALIGARWNGTAATDHFHGWIEEVRIWNGSITLENIRFTMNQRLKGTGNIGEVVDMVHPDAPSFANLAGYYRLISAVPDPINLVTHDANLLPTNGTTIDLAVNPVPGILKNMETNQENTAPLPYISGSNGAWDTEGTWARGSIWDLPNNNIINWNIVRLLHNVNSPRDITVLGIDSQSGTFDMLGTIPTNAAHAGTGTGKALTISHYLKLNGIIDLNGESQLLQPPLSIVDPASSGHLDRDQQGKKNSYIYNYWASPVSTTGSGNNGGYTVGGVLLDGTIPSTPQIINFQDYHGAADGALTSPITLSTYWLWAFTPATANVYAEWDHIRKGGSVRSGEGFTMKGPTGNAGLLDGQNYTFRGLPHNGDIDLTMKAGENYLIGNPYPSAFDGHEFIRNNIDRGVFDGSLYFWDHFSIQNHILKEYIGGYGVINLTSSKGVPAVSIDERINPTDDISTRTPTRIIPVGQGFLINSSGANGGQVRFRNSQRTYLPDGDQDSSLFLRPENQSKENKSTSEEYKKIRLSFSSPIGYRRQILVGAVPTATDGFDLGYDANLFDNNVEDMYWVQGSNNLVIQAVADFNKERVLPLGVKIKENKEFTIRIDTVENADKSIRIYLNDKLNDSIHDLRKGHYVSKSEPGTINDRFEIIFFKEEPVPPVVEIPAEVDEDDEIYKEFGISVRHGQTDRELQILNPHELSITNMYIFDLNGNKLEGHNNLPGGKEFRMPVRNYSSGIYIVQLVVEGRVVSKKILINN